LPDELGEVCRALIGMDEKDELGLPTVRVLLRVERALSSFHHERSIAVELQQSPSARAFVASRERMGALHREDVPMRYEDQRLFRRRRKDGSLSAVWHGWFYDATGKQVCRSTNRTDRRAAARVRAGWERDAAEPGHAVARDAVLLDAIELLLHARKEQVSAGRKSEATFGFYREKTGHWLRVLGEDFPLARLSGTDVDRYITHRRSEWSVPPRDPVLDEEMFSSRRERAGM